MLIEKVQGMLGQQSAVCKHASLALRRLGSDAADLQRQRAQQWSFAADFVAYGLSHLAFMGMDPRIGRPYFQGDFIPCGALVGADSRWEGSWILSVQARRRVIEGSLDCALVD